MLSNSQQNEIKYTMHLDEDAASLTKLNLTKLSLYKFNLYPRQEY